MAMLARVLWRRWLANNENGKWAAKKEADIQYIISVRNERHFVAN